jgi:hypothetical protein
MRRGVSFLLVILMLLNTASVWAEPTVTLAPTQVYETNHASFMLNISNFRNTYEIKEVKADAEGFSILALVDYKGWLESYNGSLADWSQGSIANNVVLSVFEFLAAAPVVTEDTQTTGTITMLDETSTPHQVTFPLIILNDATPPLLESILPEDNGFVKEGDSDVPIRVNATDPETGVQNVSFHWVRCNFDENITPQDHTLQLAENNGLYTNSMDLSSYDNEQQVCFDFKAYNKGGDFSTHDGVLTIDDVPPEVTLVSPVHNDIIGLGKNFSFFASDNLAPVMDCRMLIDGTEYMQDIAAPHMDVVFIASADVEEGQHTWSMICADPAGWEGQSATWTYTLDKTPPVITMTSPENNSIIADTTLLQFDVIDNYRLHKVWFVMGDNRTEMTESFSIDATSWPDGPNDFAIVADDSVGNQAEQVYRVIIDRTAPEIELVSPADFGTSDVHVNFSYRAQDNYDNEIDCTLYIDDAGLDTQTTVGGAESSFFRIIAVGEYRWKIQCVDDAGNAATSDERSVSVIDTTGPDIVMNNPDVVFRGDPITISLDVTDISGVDDVAAQLRDPDGNVQDIPLERLADTYTTLVETTSDSTLGTYTLLVRAVDTLDNSNSGEDTVLLTYKYVVMLDLSPSSTTPGSQVTASGTVLFDNGSYVPEESIDLLLPGNVTQQIALGDEGQFSYAFSAPSSDGTYDVMASITSAENNQAYSRTKQLAVSTPSGGGGGGGGGNGGTSSHGDSGNGCSNDWSCTAWSTCDGGEQERTCVDLNHCSSDDSTKEDSRSCTVNEEEEENEDATDTETGTVSAVREQLPATEEYAIDASEEDAGDAAGIGEASGFMSLANLSLMNVLLALLLATVLVGTLYKYGWAKGKKKKFVSQDILGGRTKMDLESYLDERASRRL